MLLLTHIRTKQTVHYSQTLIQSAEYFCRSIRQSRNYSFCALSSLLLCYLLVRLHIAFVAIYFDYFYVCLLDSVGLRFQLVFCFFIRFAPQRTGFVYFDISIGFVLDDSELIIMITSFLFLFETHKPHQHTRRVFSYTNLHACVWSRTDVCVCTVQITEFVIN